MEEVRQRFNHLNVDDEDEDYAGERADRTAEIIEEWLQVWKDSGISGLTEIDFSDETDWNILDLATRIKFPIIAVAKYKNKICVILEDKFSYITYIYNF